MARIRLGPAGIPIAAEGAGSANGARKCAELGLRAMEVEFVRGVSMNLGTAKELGAAAASVDVELSIHAPYYINLCSAERAKVAASRRRILDSCERGHAMGARIVVFHPGYFGKLAKEQAFEKIKLECAVMSDELRGNGWKILLGLETTGKHSAFGSLDECVAIAKKVRNCVPVVDFAHLYARAGGKIDFGKILGEVKSFGHLHSHFSCINYTAAGERNHLPLSAKKPDFRGLAREILEKKMDITIICESPLLEQDSLRMKGIFENLGYNKW
ncbi:MAG: TIM barrel protein [Candidatus Aenigmatarchaeota archaeon]